MPSWAEKFRRLVASAVSDVEIETKLGKFREPSFVLARVWSADKNCAKNIRTLAESWAPLFWKLRRVRNSRPERRGLYWFVAMTFEFDLRGSLPLAVRWARQGRPGQEDDPAYPK